MGLSGRPLRRAPQSARSGGNPSSRTLVVHLWFDLQPTSCNRWVDTKLQGQDANAALQEGSSGRAHPHWAVGGRAVCRQHPGPRLQPMEQDERRAFSIGPQCRSDPLVEGKGHPAKGCQMMPTQCARICDRMFSAYAQRCPVPLPLPKTLITPVTYLSWLGANR